MMPRRDVRPAAVAGSWYPSNPAQLEAAVDVHLAAVARRHKICIHVR